MIKVLFKIIIYLYISMITRFSIIICRWQLTSPNVEAKLSTDKLMSPTKPRFQQREEIKTKIKNLGEKRGRKSKREIYFSLIKIFLQGDCSRVMGEKGNWHANCLGEY